MKEKLKFLFPLLICIWRVLRSCSVGVRVAFGCKSTHMHTEGTNESSFREIFITDTAEICKIKKGICNLLAQKAREATFAKKTKPQQTKNQVSLSNHFCFSPWFWSLTYQLNKKCLYFDSYRTFFSCYYFMWHYLKEKKERSLQHIIHG